MWLLLNRNANDARSLTYAVSISDKNAAKVGSDTYYTWVTSYMTARVVLRDSDASAVGHEGGALLTIRPRAPGSATFTVTATDKGVRCLRNGCMLRHVNVDPDRRCFLVRNTGSMTGGGCGVAQVPR